MVPPEVSRALLEKELPAIEAWAARQGWSVKIDLDALRIEARCRHPQDHLPLLLVGAFDGYAVIPPAWDFINPYTGERHGQAFPSAGDGSIFHTNLVICAPWNKLAYVTHGGPHGDWGELTNWQADRPGSTRATTIADMLSQVDVHLRRSPGRMSPVYRLRPLPEVPARGRLVVAEQVLAATSSILTSFSGEDGSHEGIAFWLGRTIDGDTYVVSAMRPEAEHTPGSVSASESAVGAVSRRARALGLGVVAQVHSHPGAETRHSDGDDDLVLMPFDGMYSLVVASYGRGSFDPASGLGVHQFQAGRWVAVSDKISAVVVAPAEALL